MEINISTDVIETVFMAACIYLVLVSLGEIVIGFVLRANSKTLGTVGLILAVIEMLVLRFAEPVLQMANTQYYILTACVIVHLIASCFIFVRGIVSCDPRV